MTYMDSVRALNALDELCIGPREVRHSLQTSIRYDTHLALALAILVYLVLTFPSSAILTIDIMPKRMVFREWYNEKKRQTFQRIPCERKATTIFLVGSCALK